MFGDSYIVQGNTRPIRIPSKVCKYQIVKTIGKGGFAVIVLGIDETTNEKVAIKIIDREEVAKNGILKYVESELRLITKINHPNIVKVHDIIYETDIILVIMEYLSNGDAQSYVNYGITLRYDEYLSVFVQCLEALNYLHKRNIVHRDIKPENLLFDDEMRIKLIDFGLSKDSVTMYNTIVGTPMYMAPEVIKSCHYDPRAADIWSLGVTLHVFVTGRFPWMYANKISYMKDIKNDNLKINVEVGGVFGNILDNMLLLNPLERPTCQQLLNMIRGTKPSNLKTSYTTVSKCSCQKVVPDLISLTSLALNRRLKSGHDIRIPKLSIPYKKNN